MKFRIARVTCHESHGLKGSCYIVQKKRLWWWEDFIVDYDRGGSSHAHHFVTASEARISLQVALMPDHTAGFEVIEEIST